MARGKSSPDSSNNNSNYTSNSNNTSPDRLNNNANPNPTIIPNNPPRVYSPHDPRCIDCGHRRLECGICTPEVTNFKRLTWKERKALIRAQKLVRYCCNCTGVSEFCRNCDSDDDEKHPLVKYEPSESEAATQLRYFLPEALKGEQKFCPPQLCDVISHPNPGYHAENTASGSPAITAMSCRIPQPTIPNTVSVLQLQLRQVSNIFQRLVSLLSSEGPTDEALLNTTLRTLFNRLAILNHRAFPSLAKASSTGSKARQHMSQVARNEVQTAYRELWYQAQQSGLLKRVGSHDSQLRGLRVGEVEFRELLVGLEQRAAVWSLLFRAKELADKLQFWRAVVMAPRSM